MSDQESQNEAQAREYLAEITRRIEAGETDGELHIGGDDDWSAFVDGLMSLATEDIDPLEYWCPNCEAYAEFTVVDTVHRPDFEVVNLVVGCPNCRYTTIDATNWTSTDALDATPPGRDPPERVRHLGDALRDTQSILEGVADELTYRAEHADGDAEGDMDVMECVSMLRTHASEIAAVLDDHYTVPVEAVR